MPTKDERRAEAEKHVALMNAVFSSDTQACVESARIFEDGEGRELPLPDPAFEETRTVVKHCTQPDALFSAQGTLTVLDPASFTRPAGGYLDGAGGPETLLCAESNLCNVLQQLKKIYYDKNRQSARGLLFTDRALLLSDVTFMRNGKTVRANVVAAAAPNRTRALENNRAPEECDADLKRRIETVMRLAVQTGCETLILNDFGCGLGNGRQQVADLFKAWLDEHPGQFASIVFAIPGGPSLEVFQDVFGREEKPDEKPQALEKDQEEDDEESWEDIELPEGVTLR